MQKGYQGQSQWSKARGSREEKLFEINGPVGVSVYFETIWEVLDAYN